MSCDSASTAGNQHGLDYVLSCVSDSYSCSYSPIWLLLRSVYVPSLVAYAYAGNGHALIETDYGSALDAYTNWLVLSAQHACVVHVIPFYLHDVNARPLVRLGIRRYLE